MSSGANASSRVGFRGTEDLGGGLAAGFWLESGITQDSGATALAAFSRRSTVSLSGGFGELRLGRDYVPSYWNESVFDPMGAVGVGENLIKSISGNIATARGPGSASRRERQRGPGIQQRRLLPAARPRRLLRSGDVRPS